MTSNTAGASGLPITQLGSTIKAHLMSADRHIAKSDEHYKAAGLHLIEAKDRIKAGEYAGKFGRFLMLECNGIGDSRAYELIAIAKGTTTLDEVRERAREGMQRSRARAAAAAAEGVRNVTESRVRCKPATTERPLPDLQALAEAFAAAVKQAQGRGVGITAAAASSMVVEALSRAKVE